jgi:hypothetical protein
MINSEKERVFGSIDVKGFIGKEMEGQKNFSEYQQIHLKRS